MGIDRDIVLYIALILSRHGQRSDTGFVGRIYKGSTLLISSLDYTTTTSSEIEASVPY